MDEEEDLPGLPVFTGFHAHSFSSALKEASESTKPEPITDNTGLCVRISFLQVIVGFLSAKLCKTYALI